MRPRLSAALLLAFGCIQVAAAATVPLAAQPIARLDLPWWRARYDAKQAEIARGRYDLVYYGDSITQNFEGHGALPPRAAAAADWPAVWQRFYGDRHALNLGFKGDTTASLLWRIEHGEGAIRAATGDGGPRVAIVLIGANNMGRLHWPAEATLAGIDAVTAAIRVHLPHTRILLLGVLPSMRSDWVDATTRTVNAGLARRYGDDSSGAVVFVDAGNGLLRDGHADPSRFIDPLLSPPDPPLHPTAEGATRVAAAIEPTLAKMLGDRRH